MEKRDAAKAAKKGGAAATPPPPPPPPPPVPETGEEPALDTILHQPPPDDLSAVTSEPEASEPPATPELPASPDAEESPDYSLGQPSPPQEESLTPAEPMGLVGDSMAAAAERAALDSLEQSEAGEQDPVDAEADRRVAEAAAASRRNPK